MRQALNVQAPLVATAQGSSLDGAVRPPRSRLLREAPGRKLTYKAGRKLTVMCYLNGHWQPSSGGELVIWPRPPPSRLPGSGPAAPAGTGRKRAPRAHG